MLDGQDCLLFLEIVLISGLVGGGSGGVETPASLFAAFEKTGHLSAVGIWAGGIAGGQRDVGSGNGEVRILAKASLDFLRFDGE